MREILPELLAAYRAGEPVAMATVIRTWKSAPRPAGAAMLVTSGHEAVGSVSGGCVEGALFDVGLEILDNGVPQYHKYGISDDEAFGVGLTCGGIIEVFAERVDTDTWPELEGVAASVEAEEAVAIATIVAAPDDVAERIGRHLVIRPSGCEGSLGTERLDDTVREDALGMLAAGTTGFLHYGGEGERLGEGLDVFVASYAPPAQLFVFGAIDFSASLVRVGKVLGYRVTVCDARPIFATAKRFPEADGNSGKPSCVRESGGYGHGNSNRLGQYEVAQPIPRGLRGTSGDNTCYCEELEEEVFQSRDVAWRLPREVQGR